MTTALMSVYNRLPVAFSYGKGAWLWDQAGNKYLDAITGIGVCILGHAHPAVTKAINEQAEKLLHTSNMFTIPEQEKLAEELTSLAGMDKAFFGNSGAEANEAAIKLARLYGHQRGIEQPHIIVAEKSFHGRTLATLSASGSRKIQAGFEPLVTGFVRAPFNDLQALQTIAEHNRNIVAILIEPILGNGGIIIPDDEYLKMVRQLCDKHGWLLILDEIQTGMGRTGKFFAFQHTAIKPDIITVAKGLANGIPIGACLAQPQVSELFKLEKHGSTFGGNPFACHVARAVIHTIQTENLAAQAIAKGNFIKNALQETLGSIAGVVAIRGQGLMIGIELDRPCRDVLLSGLSNGLICNVTAEKVIRLLPPLIISMEEAQMIVERLTKSIREFLAA